MKGIRELRWIKAKDLQENPKNWRKHPVAQRRALKDSLKRVGWAGAALYNETTKRLIDGHLRKDVAEDEEIPVLVGNWTEEEEKYILTVLDPITYMAEVDEEVFKNLKSEVLIAMPDAAELLKEISEKLDIKEKFEAEEDEVPEPRATSETKRGTIAILGRHRLMCGDCTDPADVAKLMDGKKADMVFTDPPYGVSYADKNSFLNE